MRGCPLAPPPELGGILLGTERKKKWGNGGRPAARLGPCAPLPRGARAPGSLGGCLK